MVAITEAYVAYTYEGRPRDSEALAALADRVLREADDVLVPTLFEAGLGELQGALSVAVRVEEGSRRVWARVSARDLWVVFLAAGAVNDSVTAINQWGRVFASAVVERVIGRERIQPHDVILRRTYSHVPGVVARTLAEVERGLLSPDAAQQRMERLLRRLDEDAATDAQLRHALGDAVRAAAARAPAANREQLDKAPPAQLPLEPPEPDLPLGRLHRSAVLAPSRRRPAVIPATAPESGAGAGTGGQGGRRRRRGVVVQHDFGRAPERVFYEDEPPPWVW